MATTLPDRSAHVMPFGAEVRADGSARFRLWAPTHTSITLVLEDLGRELPMEPRERGWFELVTDAAAPGTRYRYLLENGLRLPDPASRFQPEDVHGPSVVVDPRAYVWRERSWRGRPWEETVLYELHVGAFSAEGTFDGLRRKLDYLAGLGVTAVELMPLSDFAGTRNWGYDGVLPFAPDSAYGRPEDLKRLIDEAHARGLMVFLDVVYNHFGPEGNYLHVLAPDFFEPDIKTPWGEAINYQMREVRDWAVNNVLYWLQEYRFDGLRFDAVDRITDPGDVHILTEIAETVRRRIPASEREVHLVLENDRNEARRLERAADGRPRFYDAQWNDDIHHVYHRLLTGESGGYYVDYVHDTIGLLARALAAGFVYQGEKSHHRDGEPRGEESAHLPPTAFVGFLQNHDQIGNRAFGERIADLAEHGAVRAAQSVLLLSPQVPLLFMGEEWGAVQPFCFFTDFHDELADAVREGRRREFQKFPQFASEEARSHIPDPNAESTFAASRLDWSVTQDPPHAEWLDYVKELLRLRRDVLVPRLRGIRGHAGRALSWRDTALRVAWTLGDGSELILFANLGDRPVEVRGESEGELLFEARPGLFDHLLRGELPPWCAVFLLRASA